MGVDDIQHPVELGVIDHQRRLHAHDVAGWAAGPNDHARLACKLLHGGGFGLIVFDLGDIPESIVRRVPMASWFRLRLAAEKTGTALIALTPAPQTRSCSAVRRGSPITASRERCPARRPRSST